MPEPGLLASKVRSYMESLSPTARSMLLRTLRASGSLDLPSEVILKAVEGLELAEEAPAVATPAGEPWSSRLETAFFAPAESFLCDDDPVDRLPGRLPRPRLAAVWTWIRRDLAAAAYERALAADPHDPQADARPIARKLRREVVPAMIERLRDAGSDPKLRQRIAGQLGGEPAYRCLSDLAYVFQNETAFGEFLGHLPRTVTAFDVVEPSRLCDLARTTVDQGVIATDWIAAAILARTANPVVLVHLACRLAGTTDPRLVASGRYAPFVDTVIACIEQHVRRASGRGVDPASRDGFLADLRAYHEVARNLELALPIESVSAWFRRLGAARAAMSDVVAKQLEAAPGLVRRSLRVDNHGGWSDRFDAADFADAEFAVRVTLEARLAVDSLAVNELALRARKQVENTLELVSARLMDALKTPTVHDRAVLLQAVDGAIRLCGLVFGEEYAAVLRKSRDLGIQKPLRAG
jgi:hypothetical protein